MAPKKDSDYGIGERADGTIDAFPASELQQRLAEWRAQQEADTEPDDLSDLDEVEELFDEPESEEAGKGGQAADGALPFGELPALAAAATRDRLGYVRGLRAVVLLPDTDQWNAAYNFDDDMILVQGKFGAKDDADKVQTFLHEIGHRGERVDPKTFEAFKAAGLGQLPVFLAMANKTHLDDYERTGKVDGADREAFAESYSRACLGIEMPPEVAEFWRRRMMARALDERPPGEPRDPGGKDAKVSKESVDYVADWGGEETACRRCSMFRWQHDWPEDNRCTLVRGDIDARGHCRRWVSALASDAGPPDEARDPGGKWTGGGKASGLKKWFGGSKIADEKGRPRVVYKSMVGSVPHMSEEGLTHVALRREVAERFSEKGKPVRRMYVRAKNPFDYRDDADREWLIKEMAKPKNVALFNKQTNEIMNSTGKGNYDYEHSPGEIAAGIEEGAYQVFEIPMIIDMIKRRGHDGIYMAEDSEGDLEPNLAVFSPDQIRPVASFAKDEVATDEWEASRAAEDEWNESQHPRGQPENAGEFASVAGGGAGGKEATEKAEKEITKAAQLFKPAKRSTEEIVATVPGAERAIAALAEKFKGASPTDAFDEEGGFKEMDGTYTPQRAAVHRKILSEIFNPEAVRRATPKAGDRPRLTILGGRGGSGKSWFTKEGGPVDTSTSILLDSDAIKAMLPGYEHWKAPLYHEEATDLLALADAIATKLGVNTIHDATMKSEANTARRMEQYQAARYDVNGYYMYASPDVAAERALRRFSRGGKFDGRFVPPEVILKKNVDNEKNFDKLIPQFKKWAIYDNDSPAGPKLVAEGGQ